jgi:hypothetical protein
VIPLADLRELRERAEQLLNQAQELSERAEAQEVLRAQVVGLNTQARPSVAERIAWGAKQGNPLQCDKASSCSSPAGPTRR